MFIFKNDALRIADPVGLEFEAFLLPRLAVNVGLNYARMFILNKYDEVSIHGATCHLVIRRWRVPSMAT